MNPAPPVITTFGRAIRPTTTRGAYSRFLRTCEMGNQGGHGPGPMGEAVLLRQGHLGEGPRLALRQKNRVESEAPGPSRRGSDGPAALPVKDVVGLTLPKEEHRLERRGARL